MDLEELKAYINAQKLCTNDCDLTKTKACHTLDLRDSDNYIGSKGCEFLKDIKVHTLDLSRNKIDSKGCEFLKDIKVHTLDLSHNKIDSKGCEFLKDIKVHLLF